MNQYSGFTPRAASVLAGAQQAAQGMGHTYIGSEHLLLALLREGAGAAYTLLTQRRITAAKAERLLLQMVGRGHPTLLCAEDATEHYRAALEEALPVLERELRGFASPDAVLTAVETRSSSPVRILRDETCQSALRGLYPCGEGAGYAGGIMSAAADGMRCAEQILEELRGEAQVSALQ